MSQPTARARAFLARARDALVATLGSVRWWFLVAVGLGLASGYVRAPSGKAPRENSAEQGGWWLAGKVNRDLDLRTLDAVRAVPEHADGVSLTIELERHATDVAVRATLRNEGSQRYIVSWPESCRAGSVVYREGRDAIFFRAVRFQPSPSPYWMHTTALMHDGERMWEGFGVALEPGDEIIDSFGLREADAACVSEGRVARTGKEIGDATTLDRVLVGYDLTVSHPEWEGRLNPDGRRKVPDGCEWTFMIAASEVPSEMSAETTLEPAPRWSRIRSLAPLDQRRGEVVLALVPPSSYPRLGSDQLAHLEARIEYFGPRDWREVLSRSGVEPQFYAHLRNELIEAMTPEERYGRDGAPSPYQLAIRKELERLQQLGRKGLRLEDLGPLPPGAR